MNGRLKRFTGKSANNTAQTVSSIAGSPKTLKQVTVAFSGAPQYGATDLSIVLNSGKGAEYDVVLSNGVANGRYLVYVPTDPITLMDDDIVDVNVPAAGAVTSAVTLITEERSY